MKVRWSSAAEDDRDTIREYIAADNPRAAIAIDEALGIAVGQLAVFPLSGRAGVLLNTRELLAHKHYRIIYEIRDDAIWITAVVHTAREWPPAGDEP